MTPHSSELSVGRILAILSFHRAKRHEGKDMLEIASHYLEINFRGISAQMYCLGSCQFEGQAAFRGCVHRQGSLTHGSILADRAVWVVLTPRFIKGIIKALKCVLSLPGSVSRWDWGPHLQSDHFIKHTPLHSSTYPQHTILLLLCDCLDYFNFIQHHTFYKSRTNSGFLPCRISSNWHNAPQKPPWVIIWMSKLVKEKSEERVDMERWQKWPEISWEE